MKKITVILFLLAGFVSEAQITRYYTAPTERAYFKGIVISDSGFVNARRDTNFTAPFLGFQVFRPADSTLYYYASITAPQHWNKVGSGAASYIIGYGLLNASGTLKVDSTVIATKLFAKYYADSLKGVSQNIYAGSLLYPVNDSTIAGDSTLIQTRLRSKKVIFDSLPTTTIVWTGPNSFTNSTFKIPNTPWNGDVTKTKIPVIDTTTGIVGHQAAVYTDLTGIGNNDHIKYDLTNGKFIVDNVIYYGSSPSGNIPYGTGVSWQTSTNFNWSQRILHLTGTQSVLELSATGTSGRNWIIVSGDNAYTYPFIIGDSVNAFGTTIKLAINADGSLVIPSGQVFGRRAVTGNYTLAHTDYLVCYTTLSATAAITPSSGFPAGQIIVIKDETGNAGTNNITWNGTLDGATNPTIINTAYGTKRVYYNGTAWFSLN